MEQILLKIGERLKKIGNTRQLTPDDVAELAGVQYGGYHSIKFLCKYIYKHFQSEYGLSVDMRLRLKIPYCSVSMLPT